MKFKNMILFIALFQLIIFYRPIIAAQRSMARSPSFGFGNFLVDHNRRLFSNSDVLNEIQVKSAPECNLACVDTDQCQSTNVENKAGVEKRKCQLMKSDKYKKSVNMINDANFAHFHFQTPCSDVTCSNGGTCLPEYKTGEYTCACIAGYTGQHCGETDASCGSILHRDTNNKDMNTNDAVPAGWVLCFIDQTDTAYHHTSCNDLVINVGGYATSADLLNAGGNFGCWHGMSGSQEGASYSSNSAVKNACNDNKQQTTKLSAWSVTTTTLAVCIRIP